MAGELTFTEEERDLINTPAASLTPQLRGERFLLFLRSGELPGPPGSAHLPDALILRNGPRSAVNELAAGLSKSAVGTVDLRPYGGGWHIAREGVSLVLAYERGSEAIAPSPRGETVAEILWTTFDGGDLSLWRGMTLRDVDLVAGRFIEQRVPELYDQVPVSVRARLGVPGAPTFVVEQAPTKSSTPRVEIRAPPPPPGPTAEEIGQAVASGVRSVLPELTETLKKAFESATVKPYVPPLPQPAPPPPPPPPVPAAVSAPFVPSEVPKTRAQVTLFGEKAAAPTTIQPLAPLAAQLEDKYRPLFLNQVIGNPEAVAVLRAAVPTGSFQKLYIVEGRPGLGKTTAVVAAIRDYLAQVSLKSGEELFNPRPAPSSPTFGIDPSVLLYENALDVVKKGGPSALLGDVARFTRTGGLPGVRKFAVLDDITRFTKDQQEILLPLTERYPQVTFFLIANNPDYIDALRSRARTLRFARPEPEEVVARLVEIIRQEAFPFPDPLDEARSIVRSLGGNLEFRQAVIRLATDAATLGAQGGG